ncbi:MAG: pilus assembly protein PilM [Phycisphaeraceae bacterium]|nr:pilus assembly protein PilM [Phycisphaeraceae bacterium]
MTKKSNSRHIHRARGPIGLDLGDCYIKAVQLDHAAAADVDCRIASALVLERLHPGEPFDAAEAMRLRDVLSRHNFIGRQVVINVPGKMALTSVLSLPPRKEGIPLEQIARGEMAHEHRHDPDSFEMACWDLPKPARGSGGTTVMAVACRHEHSDALLAALGSAGFDVVGLDAAGWAVTRACRKLVQQADDGITAIVDLGWDSTSIALIHSHTVVYQRSSLGCGMHHLRQALQREQQYPPQVIDYLLCEIGFELEGRGDEDDWKLLVKAGSQLEAHFGNVVRELTLTMDYAHSQYPQNPVKQVLLLGGGAGVPGVDAFIAAAAETQVTTVRPADLVANAENLGELAMQPSLIPALGLARSHVASEQAPDAVNLVPDSYRILRRRKQRSRRWAVAVLAYAAALVVGWGVLHHLSGGAQRATASQLTAADQRIADADQAIQLLQPRLKDALATMEAGRSVGDQPDWSILLQLVAGLLNDDAVLSTCRLAPTNDDLPPDQRHLASSYTLHLEGLTRAHETVSEYVLALEDVGLFDSVKLLSTQREPWGAQTAVAFQIDLLLGGPSHE